MEAIGKIDKYFKELPKSKQISGQKLPYIKYYLQQDAHKTGNLEVTVHPFTALKHDKDTGAHTVEGEGIPVHSKAKTGRYIVQDMHEFLEKIFAITTEKKDISPKLWSLILSFVRATK